MAQKLRALAPLEHPESVSSTHLTPLNLWNSSSMISNTLLSFLWAYIVLVMINIIIIIIQNAHLPIYMTYE